MHVIWGVRRWRILLAPSKKSATWFELLTRPNKKVDWQNQELADREKVLGVAPDADDELRAKVVLPHIREELVD